jgi:hypothetical protein
MGASGWQYVVEAPDGGPVDPGTALARLRARVLAEGDFFWDRTSEQHIGPRPASLDELDALRDTDEFWEIGTHSILDVDQVVGSDEPWREGAVRPLTTAEAEQLFGTTTPDRAQLAAVDVFGTVDERWTGRCQVLYADGRPAEVAFWGFSGD